MPAFVPLGLRGLVWFISGIGLGSLFGGDETKVERQEVIQQTTAGEKIMWIALCICVVGLLIALFYMAYKHWF